MKLLLSLALLSTVAFATENKPAEPTEAAKAEAKLNTKKAAYKAAKDACLKENKDLKGRDLKECILSKTK
jgi:hypothetical protein